MRHLLPIVSLIVRNIRLDVGGEKLTISMRMVDEGRVF